MESQLNETVAFIGLGAMGAHMARNLQNAGYRLRVFNRTPERMQPLVEGGAVACNSPGDAARGARFVVSMVSDDQATREVMLGLRAHGPGRWADRWPVRGPSCRGGGRRHRDHRFEHQHARDGS